MFSAMFLDFFACFSVFRLRFKEFQSRINKCVFYLCLSLKFFECYEFSSKVHLFIEDIMDKIDYGKILSGLKVILEYSLNSKHFNPEIVQQLYGKE